MIIRTAGTQKQSIVVNQSAVAKKMPAMLHYKADAQLAAPEETLRGFVADIKKMITKYEVNKARLAEIEPEINDLEHYIEIAPNQRVPSGYKLYRKLAELRRERRICKNENDLLWPIYEHFHATEVLPKLANVQGECSKVRGAIDARVYTVRTDVLTDYLKEGKEESGK